MNSTLDGALTARLIALRRELHQHPELSTCEQETARRLEQQLTAIGLAVKSGVGGHGLVVDVVGAQPGPMLAYRADIDALPITETNDVPYQSLNEGVMHACGHDVHATIGVGVASALAQRRDEMAGSVRFLFQPAEEGAAPEGTVIGAEAMAREGALEGVEAVFAVHCMPEIDVGRFAVGEGAVWANSDVFEARLSGRSSHAAYPHEGIDSIQMAGALIPGLLAIPARLTNALRSCVLTIGTVHAGKAHNIVADEARLTGILRTFDEKTRQIAITAMERLVTGTARAYGGEGSLKISLGARAVINHSGLESAALAALNRSTGTETMLSHPPQLGAEDFSAFSRRVPGCYLYLGVRNEAQGIVHPIHTPQFNVDEACIPFAVSHLSNMLIELGQDWSRTPIEAGAVSGSTVGESHRER